VNAWPYLVVIVLLAVFMLVSIRNRKRQVAEEMVRVSRIGVGAEVMTTSGLYGTVVAKHDDGTVLLAIAPGVEVKWAAAALRDASSLSEDYRRGLTRAPGQPDRAPDNPHDEAAGPADLRKRGGDSPPS
jgi:preprotein translocase subunit YajC